MPAKRNGALDFPRDLWRSFVSKFLEARADPSVVQPFAAHVFIAITTR